MPGYSNTLGLKLVEDLAREGNWVFHAEDAKAAGERLGLSGDHVLTLLSALSRSGWVTRLRRGLYAVGETPLGGAAPHPFVIATRLVEPSAVSHWSALQHHGLTEQVPQAVTASTPKKVVTPSMRTGKPQPGGHAWEVAGVRYEYFTVKPSDFFGIARVWMDERSRIPVTDPERTVLDCFIAPERFGGIGEGLGVLEEHLHRLDVPQLVAYALRHGKGSVVKRLGWALERAGAPQDSLAPLRAYPMKGCRPLDPGLPQRGPCDREWGIRENKAVC